MGKVFGSPPNFLDLVTASEYSTSPDAKIVYEVIGGDLSDLKEDTTVRPTRVNWKEWRSTVKGSEAMFIGIDKDGLIPLYELITDAVKKAAVKEFVEEYLKAGEVTLID